jgi:PAS domain S-box-containing protein
VSVAITPEERYSAIFSAAGDAILLCDGVFRDCNPAALSLFRASSEQIEGFSPGELSPGKQRDGRESGQVWRENISRVASEGTLAFEWQFLRPDGSLFDVSVTMSEVRVGAEAMQLMIVRENSYLVGLRANLESANSEIDSLTYAVSHDLRAAIRGISVCSGVVLEDYSSQLTDDAKRWLNHIHDDSVQLDSFTASLLELSRLSSATFHPVTVDMSALAHEIARELSAIHPDRRVEFTAGNGIAARGDPPLLRVLMTNLLDNAWKFTAETPEPKIEFGVRPGRDAETVFFVRDNGPGFDMSHSNRLFVPFQKLHRATVFPGSGMGLAFVRRIAHRHGGKVWARSGPGEGATFFFTLGRSVTG